MDSFVHGGDVYRNKVNIDFSVNINPLGVPSNVKDAMLESIKHVDQYPDIRSERLIDAIANRLSINKNHLIIGNGSSELFMAIANTLKPKKVLIPVPSFYGYEYAFSSACDNIFFYPMKEEDGYRLTKDFVNILDCSNDLEKTDKSYNDVDCIVLANPNNPTGALIDGNLLIEILDVCKNTGIKVILDECFIGFTNEESAKRAIGDYSNLIIVRSFTKLFAIPSVRLGYAICSDEALNRAIKRHLPEWNVSGVAQSAGYECTKCMKFISDSKEYVEEEREYLLEELKKLGLEVFNSSANYILIFSEKLLYDLLLEQGILLRDCSNYRGLREGYYRIAVRTHEENIQLINALKACS